jgi:WD40 repeat protein
MSTAAAQLDITQAHEVAAYKHDRPLTFCRFDPTGRYVFVAAQDEGLHRFSLTDGAKVSFLGGHDAWIHAIAFDNAGAHVISGGCDGRLVWWDAAAAEPKPIRTLEAHHGWIRSLATSPDGKLLASGGNDRVVRLWDTADGTLAGELSGHELDVYCAEFHPSGEFLLTGDLLGSLRQWDVASQKEVRALDASALHTYEGGQQVHFGGVRGIAVSPDRKYLAAGGLYKASNPLGSVHEPLVRLFEWDNLENALSQIADGIPGGVLWRVRYLADGVLLGASGGTSGGILLFWKPGEEKAFHRVQLPSITRDMDLAPDGLSVADAHFDGHLRITRLAAKAT